MHFGVYGEQLLGQPARFGGLYFNQRLFRLELENRFALRDRVADLFQPAYQPGLLHHQADFRNL